MTSRAKSNLRRARLIDVATAAGVSVMTVSNVVNGKTDRLSEGVLRHVRSKLEELNYVPDLRGRGLRLDRDFAIGLVMLHPERRFLNDPFNTEVAAGMSNELARNGYGLLVVGAKDLGDLEKRIARLSQLDALAVYVFGEKKQRTSVYRKLAHFNLPMMIISDDPPKDLKDCSFVRQKNEDGAFRLAKIGIKRGAKNILFIRPNYTWPAMEEREAGARKAASGKASFRTMVCAEIDFRAVVQQVREELKVNPPDFIMGGNDLFGIAATQAARSEGFSINTDMLITGFNGFSFREYSIPVLTSMRSPAYEIGEATASGLLKRIVDGKFPPAKVFEVDYLAGETCAQPGGAPARL